MAVQNNSFPSQAVEDGVAVIIVSSVGLPHGTHTQSILQHI